MKLGKVEHEISVQKRQKASNVFNFERLKQEIGSNLHKNITARNLYGDHAKTSTRAEYKHTQDVLERVAKSLKDDVMPLRQANLAEFNKFCTEQLK